LKKNFIIIGSFIIVASIIIILIFSLTHSKVENSGIKEISADLLASNPEQFSGYIGLSGTVKSIDISNHLLGVGCQDACIIIPVKYYGTMPQMNSNVVVYGILKSENGRYYFDGQEVKYK
jgi:hypothetical protein